MGQTDGHLLNKILKKGETLLCLSETALGQKSVLKPSEMDDCHSVRLQCAYREVRQGLHHQDRAYGYT